MTKGFLHQFAKYMLISAIIFVMTAILSLFFAFFTRGYFSPVYIFIANFIIGGMTIIIGLWSLLSPDVRFGNQTVSTYSRWLEYNLREKLKDDGDDMKIMKIIYVGICITIITLPSQYLFNLIWR